MNFASSVALQPLRNVGGDLKQHRHIFEQQFKRLQLQKWTDWYQVTRKMLSPSLMHLVKEVYGDDLILSISVLFPEHHWQFWKFDRVPERMWDNIDNQRKLFDHMAAKLGLQTWEDWYKVSYQQVVDFDAATLIVTRYGKSLRVALSHIYPEREWRPWHFYRVATRYWEEEQNVREYLRWFEEKMQIRADVDWGRITVQDINENDGGTLLQKYGGIFEMISKFYPDRDWSKYLLHNHRKANKVQSKLFRSVKNIFASQGDVFLTYVHPDLRYPESHRAMELDVYIPSLRLAFEYQGIQHYQKQPFLGTEEKDLKRDSVKRKACDGLGITLIEIPYWWDQKKESLMATIKKHRSDLLSDRDFPYWYRAIPASPE
eukprot:TRINITY_DN8558_c0_g1_i1.p1 TRINITY_DN8558_c0_g1~~TRINITY_DN8558_c0_g1_i1.p1  ORF type:complete len:373 (-),score=66.08 TRINITY_DN8558_c0_g1_i1:152-1270(-)